MTTHIFRCIGLVLVLAASAGAQAPDSAFMAGLRWRPIGPANMGGRVSDVEGLPSPSATFYVVSVAGGVFKTTNGGTTFRALFQNERVASLSDLAIAPSDTMQLWLGTGEEDARNSISPGGGIYKSINGGTTWKLMGLEKTEHIGRVVVHPTNPDIVYVAAIGATWRANPERGLYKTEDGGVTWKLIKFISDKAGFIDVVMDPTNPNVLFAASYERVRGPYFMYSGGPGSALWKSSDAGATWTEIKGGGFPATRKGRIGLAIAPSDARVVYALVEAEPPAGLIGREATTGPRFNCRNVGAGGCGLYRSKDGGATWEWMNGNNVRPFYYSQVRVDVRNPERVYWSSTPVNFSNDGGKTIGTTTGGLHVDHHAMWLDPANEHHMIVGNDGGIGVSWDKGGTFDFVNNFPIGQFYNISVDMRIPYWVCGGLQDNGAWCGPSRKAGNNSVITNADWIKFNGGDGFVTQQDPRNWNIIYGESQGGSMVRFDLKSGLRTSLRKPSWLDAYRAFEDSIVVERGDTANMRRPAAQKRIDDLRMRQVGDSVSLSLRWNWNTPFLLSAHNPDVFYAGANRVMKSSNRGDDMRPVSPDLTYNDSAKIYISTRTTGGITKDTTGAETYGTIVSLAESPLRAGVLFAGTDDGRLWTTVDDGRKWNEHTRAFAKLVPAGTYISRIEPSRATDARFYVTFDNHRNGDFTPYVLVTDDGGKTFRSIAAGLPRGGADFVHVIREDPVNTNLLYVGTDVGAYMSLDRGATWHRFMHGLPTTPVHDLKIHPRDRELVAGTHGRSIWVVDVAPLQQYTPQLTASEDPVLLDIKPALAFMDTETGAELGHRVFAAQSPPSGAEITYWITKSPEGRARARVVVLNEKGDTMQTLNGFATRGLQRVYWDLRKRADPPRPLSAAEKRDSALIEVRLAVVTDSMVKAGTQKAAVDRLVTRWREAKRTGTLGGFGGGGGGGGGGAGGGATGQAVTGGPLSSAIGVFSERPSETPPRAANAPATPATPPAAPATPATGESAETPVDSDQVRVLDGLVQLPGRPNLRPLSGGFGGNQPLVAAGAYTVILEVGGKTATKVVQVVKPD